MAKAEFGTPKFLSNQMKAKGLQKLKWYCQVCQKQCRDDNGFKSHIRSETHVKNISSITSSDIQDFSSQFQSQFVFELKNYHGEKFVNVNRFYNQLIQNKSHIHLNSTKWVSLSQFVRHLSSEGIVRLKQVEGTEGDDGDLNSWDISYINNSNEAVLRKANSEAIEKSERSEEETSAKILRNQIKKSQRSTEEKEDEEVEQSYNIKKSTEPIKIQLGSIKKNTSTAGVKKGNVFKVSKQIHPNANPLRANPLKK